MSFRIGREYLVVQIGPVASHASHASRLILVIFSSLERRSRVGRPGPLLAFSSPPHHLV